MFSVSPRNVPTLLFLGLGLWFISIEAVRVDDSQQQPLLQSIIDDGEEPEISATRRDAFLIFNSIHSLLHQWGNTLAPNGFSYTFGTIPKGMLLYHGRKDAKDPPSPEWLAFDPEMSFGIMGAWGPSWLRVYRATRELGPVLYLDGMSASLMASGVLDSQQLFLYGTINQTMWDVWDEYGRAADLCEWGATRRVEGFVRQNAGFELIWCDFSSGVELVSNMNVEHWTEEVDEADGKKDNDTEHPRNRSIDNRDDFIFDFDSDITDFQSVRVPLDRFLDSHQDTHTLPTSTSTAEKATDTPRRGPPRMPRGRYRRSPFADYAAWEWYRSAVAVYAGESRVNLDFGSFITGYGRADLPFNAQRLGNLSENGVAQLKADVEEALLIHGERRTSGVDWQDITTQIVHRYERRLPELHSYLSNTTTYAKALKVVATLLLPHYVKGADRHSNMERCTTAFTTDLRDDPSLNKYETKTLLAIETVHQAVCHVLFDIYDKLKPPTETPDPKPLVALMEQLGWTM